MASESKRSQINQLSDGIIEFSFNDKDNFEKAKKIVDSLKSVDYSAAISNTRDPFINSARKSHKLVSFDDFKNWMLSLGVTKSSFPLLQDYYLQFDTHGNFLGTT